LILVDKTGIWENVLEDALPERTPKDDHDNE
jgi:hypothetical protein